MKFSISRQELIVKNNVLPETKRWISSIREEYKVEKTSEEIVKEVGLEANEPLAPVFKKDATTYEQSSEVLGLTPDYNLPNLEESTLPSFVESTSNVDKVKVIGITGSVGKSTTAVIVHEYIKSLGFKSVLYSSVKIESPASYIDQNEPCEIPLNNETVILDIIEEVEAYGADYLVLEINESTIKKGLTKYIPFTVRAITNINPSHNIEQYAMEEYVKLKESFFENIPADEDCTCVLGLTGSLKRDDFNRILNLNNNPKVTFGSKYICEVRNADYTNLDCLLYNLRNSLNGLELKIRVKENVYDFNTNIILPHNALNITCAIAIAQALNLFDATKFNDCIKNIVIPGREDIIRANNRTIVIGLYLMPALENFKSYQAKSEVNKIKVVTAAIGTGFVSWGKEFTSELFLSKRRSSRKFAMDYVKVNADFAYLTSNDNAAEDPLDIAKEMQSYLGNSIPSTIVVDRMEAIKRAIIESEPNDVIYISGRGNRRIFCDSVNTTKLFQDKEIVKEVLKGLGW